MHLATVKIPVHFGCDRPSASILIAKAILLTYLRCFCSSLNETMSWILVRQSLATDPGYRSNRFPLLIMLTEPALCGNSSINISIDNRYWNRFIHLEDRYFPWITTAPMCLQSGPHLGSRMHVLHSRGTGHPICDLSVGSSLLDSLMLLLFCQAITSPIIVFASSPTCLLAQTQLQSI